MEINERTLQQVLNDRTLRVNLAYDSFEWFLVIYLNHHFSYSFAPYHRELMRIVQDQEIERAFIAAFRSSGKTTLIVHAGILWSLFGKPQKKYIVLVGLTKSQIEEHFHNLRRELETNELLINDFGRSKEPMSKWSSDKLEIPSLGATVVARSTGETVRGVKGLSERPDLIICDDMDDVNSTRSLDTRDWLFHWFTSEILTLGFDNTRVIVTGNIVHPDCFLVRMEEMIKDKKKTGEFLKVPFFDSKGNANWPSRFPTKESIQKLQDGIYDPRVWKREYELIPVTLMDQVIKENDIRYYEQIPNTTSRYYEYTLIAVDPAISEKDSADFSAIVFADVFNTEGNYKIYLHSNYINEHLDTQSLLNRMEYCYNTNLGKRPLILIENSNFQEIIAQQLEQKMLKVERVNPRGVSKIDRFMSVSNLIKSGVVEFPKEFSGHLKDQILYCGMTKHDDLLDVFVYILQYVVEHKRQDSGVTSVRFISVKTRSLFR
ncbi:hypothetical protein JXA34_02020 [Patescibacteria group bacterium]|nr:hypothetical protein [Patescibacteria group bacterium]